MQKRKRKNSEDLQEVSNQPKDSEEVLNQPENVLTPSVVDQREEQEQPNSDESEPRIEQQTSKIPKINIRIN